jgi:cellulose synthase/poly-beta-1,6-N-acetylglucosamine synthase-like glycosyltransferase
MRKILVACPTADVKDYCFNEWVDNVKSFTYPNYDIYVCDNSVERQYYADKKKELETEDEFFRMGRVNPLIYPDFKYALAKSHDNCRTMALKGDYDYLLHLESDVFPPVNVIERLLDARKKVVGAMYHIELGEKSTLMIQHLEEFGEAKRETYNLGETDLDFVDGSVKKVFSCGLGCVLIHKSVLKEVPFRYEEGAPVHPDSFFFADLDMKDISAYVDTSIYCEHKNQSTIRI